MFCGPNLGFKGHSGACEGQNGSFWDQSGSLGDHSGQFWVIIFGSLCDHFGIFLASFCGSFCVGLATFLGLFWAIVCPSLGPFCPFFLSHFYVHFAVFGVVFRSVPCEIEQNDATLYETYANFCQSSPKLCKSVPLFADKTRVCSKTCQNRRFNL